MYITNAFVSNLWGMSLFWEEYIHFKLNDRKWFWGPMGFAQWCPVVRTCSAQPRSAGSVEPSLVQTKLGGAPCEAVSPHGGLSWSTELPYVYLVWSHKIHS